MTSSNLKSKNGLTDKSVSADSSKSLKNSDDKIKLKNYLSIIKKQNYFETFELSFDTSEEKIKKAYESLIIKYMEQHNDPSDIYEIKVKICDYLSQGYEILSDKSQKDEYVNLLIGKNKTDIDTKISADAEDHSESFCETNNEKDTKISADVESDSESCCETDVEKNGNVNGVESKDQEQLLETEYIFKEANEAFESGNYEKAEQQYELLTQINFDHNHKFSPELICFEKFLFLQHAGRIEDIKYYFHYALAKCFNSKTDFDKRESLTLINSALAFDSNSDFGYYVKGKILVELNEIENALECFEKAIKINPDNHESLRVIKSLKENKGKSKPQKSVSKQITIKSQKDTDVESNVNQFFSLFTSIAIFFFVFIILLILSNTTQLGISEDGWSIKVPLFYIRRAILIIAATIGFFILKLNPFTFLSFKFVPKYSLLAIPFGIALGFYTPDQVLDESVYILVFIIIFNVVANEFFFRGFILHTIKKSTDNLEITILASALLWGVFQLTFYNFFNNYTLGWQIYWVLFITIGSGLPLAMLTYFSKSMTPALICHFLANLVVLLKVFLF